MCSDLLCSIFLDSVTEEHGYITQDQDSDDEGESTSRGPRELSRREREEIEKQRAQERCDQDK